LTGVYYTLYYPSQKGRRRKREEITIITVPLLPNHYGGEDAWDHISSHGSLVVVVVSE